MGLCGKGPVPEGRGHRKVWEIGRQRNQAVVGLATEKFEAAPGEPARRRHVP